MCIRDSYDTETMETKFVENPYSMFHKIYYRDDKTDYGDVSNYENCYVKIIIENRQNSYMFETLMDKLLDVGVGHISVVDNLFDIEDMGNDIESMEDVEDTMQADKQELDQDLEAVNEMDTEELLSNVAYALEEAAIITQGKQRSEGWTQYRLNQLKAER